MIAGGPAALALAAALVYPWSTLAFKKALRDGADPLISNLVFIWITTLCVLPLFFVTSGGVPARQEWYQPLITGGLVLIGVGAANLALQRGAASVALPLLGLKLLFAAFLSKPLLGAPLPGSTWIATGIAAIAVLFFRTGKAGKDTVRGRSVIVIGLALIAAVALAATDVTIAAWGGAWGVGNYLPLIFGVASVGAAFVWVGLKITGRAPVIRPCRSGLWAGLLNALQTILLYFAVSLGGRPVEANVIYSTRGLWVVLIAALMARRWNLEERHEDGGVLICRLTGAALMAASVILLFPWG